MLNRTLAFLGARLLDLHDCRQGFLLQEIFVRVELYMSKYVPIPELAFPFCRYPCFANVSEANLRGKKEKLDK